MTREDLFAAIGAVEVDRLAKSEQGFFALYDDGLEEATMKTMKKTAITTGRVLRNLLVAAVIVSLLAVTAYAVAGYVIYDSPEEMVSSIFGNKTGFDSGEYTEIPDPEKSGGLLAVQPEYERVEADPEVVKEDVAPYVSPVGKSVTFKDMTLTVDSFLYDSGTKCGIVTYTLTNPPEYGTQYDGQLECDGIPFPASFTQYGYDYIIQEKTTGDTLAAAHYFRTEVFDEDFSVGLYYDETNYETLHQACMEEVQAQYTPEEAIEKAWEIVRERGAGDVFQESISYYGEESAAYRLLRDELLNERASEVEKKSTSPDRIVFDCSQSSNLKHLDFGKSCVTVSPISMEMDIRGMDFLNGAENTDAIREVVISFADGTEYMVRGENTANCLFGLGTSVEGSGENAVIQTYMFNRVLDLDQVTSVKINGTELTKD